MHNLSGRFVLARVVEPPGLPPDQRCPAAPVYPYGSAVRPLESVESWRHVRNLRRRIGLSEDELASLKRCKTNFSDVSFFAFLLACRSTTAARLALCARPYFSVFFPPAFVELQMAQVDRLRILERGDLGSSSRGRSV